MNGSIPPNQTSQGRYRLIPMKMGHHSNASGYDRLADYLDWTPVDGMIRSRSLRRLIGRISVNFCKRSGSRWYSREEALVELDVALDWRSTDKQIYHFLYGENCFRYAKKMTYGSASRNAMVATYHTPPNRFSEVVSQPQHIGQLDAVVLMSNSQRSAFADLIAPERIHIVQHGVDTDYFVPRAQGREVDEDRDDEGVLVCICAGRMLRDYDTLLEAARLLEQEGVPIRFQILARPEISEKFKSLSHVECFQGVTDDELKLLYQKADMMVMPMHDCTANNVLLEGMACGLPIIATDLEGVRDYTSKQCADLVEIHNPRALADALTALCSNPSRRLVMAEAARDQALLLSWPNIARRMHDVYSASLA